MRSDALQQFLTVREELLTERERIQSRLREIDQVLGSGQKPVPFSRGPRRPSSSDRRRGGNAMSLCEAVTQVLKLGPMDRRQIVDALQQLGYTFRSKDPLNSLGVFLYTHKKLFQSKDRGVFSLK